MGLLVALTVAACAATGSPTPQLSASFVQQRTDEGSARADVRLTNDGQSPAHVSGVGLSWGGYGGRRLFDADTTYEPGRTIDLPIRLGRANCASRDDAPAAVVRADGDTLTVPLDDTGTTALHEVWEHACAAQRMSRLVSVAFGPRWTPSAGGLHGSLVLTRRASRVAVAVTGLRGSVLLAFSPVAPPPPGDPLAVLDPDSESASMPVVLSSNGRCDAHALSESKQTFHLRVELAVDAGQARQLVVVKPDKPTQVEVLGLIRSMCGVG
jgi:hypothetical protein